MEAIYAKTNVEFPTFMRVRGNTIISVWNLMFTSSIEVNTDYEGDMSRKGFVPSNKEEFDAAHKKAMSVIQKQMTDSNEPENLPKDFNAEEEPKMKECFNCSGCGLIEVTNLEDIIKYENCFECKGEGKVPLTPEDIRDETEEKKENKAKL